MDLNECMQEIGEFIRFVTVEWPEVRPAVQGEMAPRCRRCILSDRCAPLRTGCARGGAGPRSARDPAQPGTGRRWSVPSQRSCTIMRAAGGGRGTDALVLFSGGKDSAYLLHRLTTQYPRLRLLAATIDNGFFSPVAMANSAHPRTDRRRSCHIQAEGQLVQAHFPPRFHAPQRGWLLHHCGPDGRRPCVRHRPKSGGLAGHTAPDCGSFPRASRRIPGTSLVRDTPRTGAWLGGPESAGFRLEDIYSVEDRKYWWDGTAWPAEHVPRVLYPFYAWPYDEQAIRRRGGPDSGSSKPGRQSTRDE